MAELIVLLKGREIAREPIRALETRVGRDPDCEILIENAGVSRVHAVVRVEGGHCNVVDQGSANGTFVNGNPVATHTLCDGDEIGIGKFVVRFDAHAGPPLPIAAPEPARPAGAPTQARKGRRNVMGTLEMSPEEARALVQKRTADAEAEAASSSSPAPAGSREWIWTALLVLVLAALAAGAYVALR